jgi:hypothetical protein
MRGNDQARTVNKAVIDRIAQIDGGPVRIQRSHNAQGRKAVPHIQLRKMQSRERSRHHRPVGQINNSR